jgi:hypothetical protein
LRRHQNPLAGAQLDSGCRDAYAGRFAHDALHIVHPPSVGWQVRSEKS